MYRKYFVLAVFLCLILTSCVSITEGGKTVKYVTKHEADKGCQEIGEVNIGQGFKTHERTQSVEDMKIKMRNKTYELGGNFLVIDTIENNDGQYSGTGRAYKCK